MFLVVVAIAQEISGKVDHDLGSIEDSWGWLVGLSHDRPGCDLQAIPLRVH